MQFGVVVGGTVNSRFSSVWGLAIGGEVVILPCDFGVVGGDGHLVWKTGVIVGVLSCIFSSRVFSSVGAIGKWFKCGVIVGVLSCIFSCRIVSAVWAIGE